MINREKNTRISVTISHEVMKIIDTIAAQSGISRSKVIAHIINNYLGFES